jgi:hypothetical protein
MLITNGVNVVTGQYTYILPVKLTLINMGLKTNGIILAL